MNERRNKKGQTWRADEEVRRNKGIWESRGEMSEQIPSTRNLAREI